MSVIGCGILVVTVSTNMILQTIVDDDKRGRVMSLYTAAFLGVAPLGALLAGVFADRIGATFIAPRLDHLGSPDGSHLDTESSERWSAAFLVLLEPVLKRCL